MTTQDQDLEQVWQQIKKAGGRQAYIEQMLRDRGLYVHKRSTDRMSKREKKSYKSSLKAEAAARKELLKETWEAYKANHIVHLGDSIYWNEDDDFDKYDHPRAEERIQENNLPVLDKPLQLADALGVSMQNLRWMTFHRDAAKMIHYERFTIPKASGGERAIWAPRPMLKGVQRWILHEIVERLPVHGAAHGFVPGRSIFTNAQQHTNAKVLLKMDLKDFFPTLTFPRVKGLFRKAGYREQIATLLALLCTEAPREVVEHNEETYFVSLGPRCLPQGAPTSPAITNAVCMRLDRRLTGLAAKYGWRFTRYADDLTFSLEDGADGEEHLGRLMSAVRFILEDEGFELHPDKTRVLRKGHSQRVTGMVVNGPGQPRVPRETRRMLRAAIHNVKNGKPFREDESLHTLLGYAAYIYMTDAELGQQYLDELSNVIA